MDLNQNEGDKSTRISNEKEGREMTVLSCLAVLGLKNYRNNKLMINLQKLLLSQKWQDYNKQDDMGLLTLYQNQQITEELITKQREKKNRLETIEQTIEEQQESARYKSSEVKVGKLLSKKTFRTPTKKRELPQRVNKTTLKRRNNNSSIQKGSNHLLKIQSVAKHERNEESESKNRQEKQVIKVGYYDVGHMSTVLNSRSLKKISVVNELSKAKRRQVTEISEQSPERQKKQSIKILQAKKSKSILNKKQREYRQAYFKGVKDLLEQNHLKSINLAPPHIQTSQSCKNYKLINHDRFNMRKKNKDFHANFKRQFNTMSQRYKMSLIQDVKPSKLSPLRLRPQLQPLSNEYVSLQSNTLSNDRAEQQYRLKQIISMFFTKQNQEKAVRHTIFQ